MTNVALIVGKQESKNPIELAEKIVENFNNQKIEGIEKIDVAGPGFINFTLKREAFAKSLSDAQDNDDASRPHDKQGPTDHLGNQSHHDRDQFVW
jgi:arginyl-tRNA synthetase